MDNMEDKLSSILGNPQMMSQIMSMAQALGQSQTESQQQQEAVHQQQVTNESQQNPSPVSGGFDGEILRKIISATKQTGVDKNQQGLLKALSPYLSRGRIIKLEKAMRAARIAGFAASALNSSGKGW